MNKLMTIATGALTAVALAACSSVPERTGSFYECDRGTKLNVNYLKDSALVRVNGKRAIPLRQVASNRGTVYENHNGLRLERHGNSVTWNTAARSAAETCRTVITPF
ncbi:MliC family protein [Sphingopyxis sp. MWB1]|uniref:MliC family protein n=1 Tax=Sphingopyxis sp. MWB1 TaxID=1537715 RepID=UPI00051A4172|nr:MliC family protein [Sphingopyxis sp. MWB1]